MSKSPHRKKINKIPPLRHHLPTVDNKSVSDFEKNAPDDSVFAKMIAAAKKSISKKKDLPEIH